MHYETTKTKITINTIIHNLFLCFEIGICFKKIRSASNEDADPFFDPFFIKKNSDLHLRKMQIRFLF